jgi:hypothetical protein
VISGSRLCREAVPAAGAGWKGRPVTGTIVIVSAMAAPSGPPGANTQPGRRVAPELFARIDGPNGYKVRGNRADQFDVIPGTYRVQVSWAYYHSNVIKVEVREGIRHHVTVCTTPLYSMTRIPLIGMLPQLAGSMVPGAALRLTVTAPGIP